MDGCRLGRHRGPARATRTASARRLATLLAAAALVGGHAHAVTETSVPRDPHAVWAVEPGIPGDNLPPAGRSLFDHVVAPDGRSGGVPFPFTALLARIGAQVGTSVDGNGLQAVLIPLGRSLQRTTAAPDYFRFPRVVVAVDGEPRSDAARAGLLLKERLYLGYQEKAAVIEVISYNEAAGRFEFQLVKDYRPGATPRVLYANRALCTACHQNGAPIFARQTWDETNANPAVAAALARTGRAYHGIAPDRGVDVPYALDNATDRANFFSAYQWLWREGCAGAGGPERAVRCRGATLIAALQSRLSGDQGFADTSPTYDDVRAPLAGLARGGLAELVVPTSDLPNRNPLATLAHAPPARSSSSSSPARPLSAQALGPLRDADADDPWREAAGVEARFDPLVPRAPLESWPLSDPAAAARRLVTGIAEFLAAPDIAGLDAALVRRDAHGRAPRSTHASPCDVERRARSPGSVRLAFRCAPASAAPGASAQPQRQLVAEGRVEIAGARVVGGTVDRLTLIEGGTAQPVLHDLELGAAAVRSTGGTLRTVTMDLARGSLHARRTDGDAVLTLQLTWQEPAGAPRASATRADRATVEARIAVAHDFAPVVAAVSSLIAETLAGRSDALAARPFRRASVMPALEAALDMPPRTWCCIDAASLPPALLDRPQDVLAASESDVPDASSTRLFFRYCALCHQSGDRSPPNFLEGDAREVASRLTQCAPRMYVRLSMWRQAQDRRAKSPMPPAPALPTLGVAADTWRDSADLARLRDEVATLLRKERSGTFDPDALLAERYEALRPCLKAAA